MTHCLLVGLPCCTTSTDDSENHTNFTMKTYLYDWFLVQSSLIQIYGTPNLPLHPSQSHSLHAEPSLREVASHIACTDQDILLGLAAVCHQSGLVQCCPYTMHTGKKLVESRVEGTPSFSNVFFGTSRTYPSGPWLVSSSFSPLRGCQPGAQGPKNTAQLRRQNRLILQNVQDSVISGCGIHECLLDRLVWLQRAESWASKWGWKSEHNGIWLGI